MPGPAPSPRGGDPVTALVTDHWFTDGEIYSLRNTAPYGANMWQNRYDPTCPAEFYRGYILALVAVAKMIGPGDTPQRYRVVIDHVDRILRTWSGTSDQTVGVSFAMTNTYAYFENGLPVPTIVEGLRGEIACVAECFARARQNGL